VKKLTGKIAVVTGGNSGIGLATAKLFAEEGAQVIITGRDEQTLAQAAAEIGAGAVAVRADVASLPDLDRLFATVREQFGGLDVLFVNAGIFKGAPLALTTEALYDEIMDINVKGAFFTIQKAEPLLRDGASIVINASTVHHAGMADSSVYAASKAAVRAFARNLSNELIGRGIRVNVVSPGYTRTPIFGRLGLTEEQIDGFADHAVNTVPMRRFGTPQEIAKAALFLASADSSYVLGAELLVDGGFGSIGAPGVG
jgi:NAD(P)-dependent dehydrogenase (short-subunit alcohol dehydrogenase family)